VIAALLGGAGQLAQRDDGDFELDRERISFVAPAENVPVAWKSIDRMLALATEDAKKAS